MKAAEATIANAGHALDKPCALPMFVEEMDTIQCDSGLARHAAIVLFTVIIGKISRSALKEAACKPDSEVGQHHLQATLPEVRMS